MNPVPVTVRPARAGLAAATAFVAAVALLASGPVFPLPEDANQPIEINAERAEMDRESGTVTYRGSVEAQQGTMRVSADEMIIKVENQKVVRITARGNPAHYQQQLEADKGLVKARADTIVYHTKDEKIDLEGSAYLEQGGTEISGELIHYDVVAGKANAEAGDEQPVHVIVQPATRSK